MLRAVPILGLVVFLMIFSLPAYGQQEAASKVDSKRVDGRTIVAVGDSLTAGQGVAENEAYPALLERKLNGQGGPFKVINAGVSGETSSGALSRIKWVLKTLNPDVVILETGANDGLRGIDPELTEKNVNAIVSALKERSVTVVLAGMRMVRNLGPEYTSKFAAIYPSVAGREGVILIPFFLAGVAGEPSLNQEDGIHPNAKGHATIANNIYPYLIDAIKQSDAKGKQ